MTTKFSFDRFFQTAHKATTQLSKPILQLATNPIHKKEGPSFLKADANLEKNLKGINLQFFNLPPQFLIKKPIPNRITFFQNPNKPHNTPSPLPDEFQIHFFSKICQ